MAFVRDFKGFSGGSGTLSDPIKINKPTTLISNGYIPEISPDGSRGPITISVGSKVYFEIDPVEIAGGPIPAFGVSVKFYEGAGGVCKLTQDKTTGTYSPEVCAGYSSLIDIVYNNQPFDISNTRFLYALVGSPDGELHEEIWATIPPSTGAEAVVQPAAVIQPVAPAVVVTTGVVQPVIVGAIVQRVPYNGGTVGVDSSGNYVPNSYIETPTSSVLPAPQVIEQPTGQALIQEPAAVVQPTALAPSISSIMGGMPSWGWIALVGVGAFMLFGGGLFGGGKKK
jgi:hypothetical protein